MPAPSEPEFKVFRRGQLRDEVMLAGFRNELRALTNPETGQLFSEDEISLATGPGSRFFLEADGIDLVLMLKQQRAVWLANQMDPRRASTRMLEELHAALWLGDDARLPAAAASGDVAAGGLPGTTFVGSTTPEDPAATVGVDGNGTQYQVLETEAVGVGQSSVRLTVLALSGGFGTNLPIGSIITWTVNKPAGATATAEVVETIGYAGVGLKGGTAVENDAQLAGRVVDTQRDRPGAGNAAQFQEWAQAADASVEQAFVYPCAFNAGSTLVVPTQRRDQTALNGPSGRLPTAALVATLTTQLVPPGSPVVPERVYVLVVEPNAQSVDLVLRIAMNRGVGGGWADGTPWPSPSAGTPESDTEVVAIVTLTSQTDFTVNSSQGLLGGATVLSSTSAPQLMVWIEASSRFEKLDVLQVTDQGSSVFRVELASAPAATIAAGDRISPYTDRAPEIALALERYFDALGPGEVVERSDPRWSRAARRPLPAVRYPAKAGSTAGVAVAMALGSVTSDVTMPVISRTEPDIAGDLAEGPNMLVLGAVSAYPEAG